VEPGVIMEAEAPAVQVGATPSGLNDAPTPTTPHVFYRPDAIPAAQSTAPKHCRSKKVSVRVVSLSLWRKPTPTHKAVRH